MVLQPVHSACCEYGAAKGQDVLIEHDAGVVHGLVVEFILLAGPGTQQHRGVQIVAAAVHGAGVALEGQTGLLLKGQSIHIGPEQNGLAGAAAAPLQHFDEGCAASPPARDGEQGPADRSGA